MPSCIPAQVQRVKITPAPMSSTPHTSSQVSDKKERLSPTPTAWISSRSIRMHQLLTQVPGQERQLIIDIGVMITSTLIDIDILAVSESSSALLKSTSYSHQRVITDLLEEWNAECLYRCSREVIDGYKIGVSRLTVKFNRIRAKASCHQHDLRIVNEHVQRLLSLMTSQSYAVNSAKASGDFATRNMTVITAQVERLVILAALREMTSRL